MAPTFAARDPTDIDPGLEGGESTTKGPSSICDAVHPEDRLDTLSRVERARTTPRVELSWIERSSILPSICVMGHIARYAAV